MEFGSKQTLQITDLLSAHNAISVMKDTYRIPDPDHPGETKAVCLACKADIRLMTALCCSVGQRLVAQDVLALLDGAIPTGISHIFDQVEGRRESTACGGFIPSNWPTTNQYAGQDGSTSFHNAASMCLYERPLKQVDFID